MAPSRSSRNSVWSWRAGRKWEVYVADRHRTRGRPLRHRDAPDPGRSPTRAGEVPQPRGDQCRAAQSAAQRPGHASRHVRRRQHRGHRGPPARARRRTRRRVDAVARTATGSATSAGPRASSSAWPSNSAEARRGSRSNPNASGASGSPATRRASAPGGRTPPPVDDPPPEYRLPVRTPHPAPGPRPGHPAVHRDRARRATGALGSRGIRGRRYVLLWCCHGFPFLSSSESGHGRYSHLLGQPLGMPGKPRRDGGRYEPAARTAPPLSRSCP
ncbi:hypothetical protein STENM327S_01600 [Streptomyces tendae]